jgi:hypothetical protein
MWCHRCAANLELSQPAFEGGGKIQVSPDGIPWSLNVMLQYVFGLQPFPSIDFDSRFGVSLEFSAFSDGLTMLYIFELLIFQKRALYP